MVLPWLELLQYKLFHLSWLIELISLSPVTSQEWSVDCGYWKMISETMMLSHTFYSISAFRVNVDVSFQCVVLSSVSCNFYTTGTMPPPHRPIRILRGCTVVGSKHGRSRNTTTNCRVQVNMEWLEKICMKVSSILSFMREDKTVFVQFPHIWRSEKAWEVTRENRRSYYEDYIFPPFILWTFCGK